MRPRIAVIARSASDEAIQDLGVVAFWIASLALAMTASETIRNKHDHDEPEAHANDPRNSR